MSGKKEVGLTKKPSRRPWLALLVAVFIAATAGAGPLATASAVPVSDPRVTPGCNGQDDFGFAYTAFATGVITNKGTATCSVYFLAYNTYDCAPISQCGKGQDLVGTAGPVTLKPGSSVTLVVNVPNSVCKLQFDPLVGWLGAPLGHLAGGAEYGTEMLAQGVGITADNPNCRQPTPTPPPPTPTPVLTPSPTATPTLPPPPTPTSPPPTATPSATPTGTQSPTATPSATPTGTQVPPTATPTLPPTQGPTTPPTATPVVTAPPSNVPKPPSAGTGMIELMSTPVGAGFLLMMVGAIAAALTIGFGFGQGRRSKR